MKKQPEVAQDLDRSSWAPIRYREFWDVPRIFLFPYRGQSALFACPFDERTEDFPNVYTVYLLPQLPEEDLTGSWDGLPGKATVCLGEVPVDQVRFDPTRRQEVDTRVIDELIARTGVA